jgi:hypothetical protein
MSDTDVVEREVFDLTVDMLKQQRNTALDAVVSLSTELKRVRGMAEKLIMEKEYLLKQFEILRVEKDSKEAELKYVKEDTSPF